MLTCLNGCSRRHFPLLPFFPFVFSSLSSACVVGLLTFPKEVTALARPVSAGKRQYVEFAGRGVIIKPVELEASSDTLVQALSGMDVVISCMTLVQLREEMALIAGANAAGVGRYVPSCFGPCCPPRGVMLAREMVRDCIETFNPSREVV